MGLIRKCYWKWYRRWRPTPQTTDPKAVFSKVYAQKLWGGDGDFYSGSGSHEERIIRPYVGAVANLIDGLDIKVHLVDIGCGDFCVGKYFVEHVDSYVACDVVPALIERNRAVYSSLKVEFFWLDAVDAPLPAGNVICIRQVLQHLNNTQIGKIVEKLSAYRYCIVTEHLPAATDFVANIDHETGSRVRLYQGSGVVLTRPPFNLRTLEETVLCEVEAPLGGIPAKIRTVAYRLG